MVSTNALHLVHIETEEADFIRKYRKGEILRTFTINAFHVLTFESVLTIQTETVKSTLHNTDSHAVDAVTMVEHIQKDASTITAPRKALCIC